MEEGQGERVKGTQRERTRDRLSPNLAKPEMEADSQQLPTVRKEQCHVNRQDDAPTKVLTLVLGIVGKRTERSETF